MSFLVESLRERLDEETGISLANTEVKATYANGGIEIYLWDQLFLIVDDIEEEALTDDAFAEEVWDIILDEFYDVREKLVELKLASLNADYLPGLSAELLVLLEAQKLDRKLLNMLDILFEDISSADKDFGLPKVGVRFTDFEGVQVIVPVDISKKPYNFDAKSIALEFDKRFKTKV
ncbi:MAG TPA: hypothetical protein VK750_02300 [Cytophagaceae bacterium]|jgi:hypothetical protein|nr:hypothetical protein [Cytophagaceae bacterium]